MKFVPHFPFIQFRSDAPVVAVVRLAGVIGTQGRLVSGLNLAGVAGLLEKAFKLKGAEAVALSINSPGGSPVQSGLIFKRIRDLAAEHKRPVYIFAEDVAASGGYMLALAGDEIYVHDASIIGSIGVVSGGFGFVEAIKKLGVERRLYTAGEKKAMLDPFEPEKEDDVARLKTLQADIHDYFKAMVRERRDGKLKAPRKELFSGDIWVGEKAVKAGLADGVGDLRGVMREKYGKDVKLRLIAPRRRLRFPFWPNPAGEGRFADPVSSVIEAIENRFWWGRFGL